MSDLVPADDLPDNIVPNDDLPDELQTKANPHADLVNKMASQPKIGDSVVNQIHEMGSGLYHGVVGGYKGLGTLISTRDPDKAADVVNEETAKTYQAPDSAVKTVMESKWNPLNYVQNATDYAADKSADLGASPGVSTAIKSAPTALAALIGAAGLLRGRPPIAPMRTFTPEEAAAQTAESQSMGAAAVPRDLSGVHPQLRQAISQAVQTTGGAVHPVAFDRHLDTAQLPLPEGSDPLWLRKGQATGDAQQISDEKNLRADPDTQGILTDSITDQDKKLVASMGEIRRQATPDIVQRSNSEHGQAAIDAIKNQDNQSVLDIRAKYKALADENGGNVPIDTGTAINGISAKLKKGYLTKTAQDNGVISSVLDDLRSGNPIDFESFENARSRLAEVQRRGGAEGIAAGIVHDALESMPLPEEAAPLKDLADTARSAAKARFDTIRDNPAYDAAINDNVPKVKGLHVIGAPSPLADSFMDRYALGNGPNASRAYVQRIKTAVPDPAISQSIEAATLNKLRDAAGIDTYGNGSFRNASYRNASNALAPKADALMSPESIEHTERLKRVSGYVNDEGKATSVNRSNTALALQRFGAQFPVEPSVGGQLLDYGTDVAAGHLGPVAVIGKRVGQTIFKKSQDAKALKSVQNAKLKFARDATKPGAGLDNLPTSPDRVGRASGGKVDHEVLVNRLMQRWKAAKRDTDKSTKGLLGMPDAAIVKALDIAQEHI